MISTPPIELHQPVIYGQQSAFEVFAGNQKLTELQLEQCFNHGAVWLETAGKPRRLYDGSTRVKRGHTLHLYCNQSTLTPCPYQAQLIEDLESFSIWDKPSGMLSQGSKWGDHWTLQRWIKQQVFPKRDCLITHRLDRFTRGLMIVAHDDTINRQFHRLFEQQQIHKTYRAIVIGQLAPGEEMTINTPVQGRTAKSMLKVIDQDLQSQRSLVEIHPESGRKHQIRVHLADLGCPIEFDRLYGIEPFSGDMQLQSSQLDFKHPLNQQPLSFQLPKKDLLHL